MYDGNGVGVGVGVGAGVGVGVTVTGGGDDELPPPPPPHPVSSLAEQLAISTAVKILDRVINHPPVPSPVMAA